MTTPSDSFWLRRAAALARRGFPAPNPRVGCVLVRGGRIVGEGHHEAAGLPHAEAAALAAAGASARGATAYVTLEPCAHTGRTPPCSEALIRAGVGRVVYGATDPNPEASGGAARLAAAGVDVLLEPSAPARAVNAAFLTAVARGWAFVFAKAACTADGHMARLDGTSQWITGPWARAAGHGLRAEAGCVLVGCETAVVDQPRLSVRAFRAVRQPGRLVVDPGRRWPGTLPTEEGQSAALRLVRSDDEQSEWEVGCAHEAGRLDPHGVAEAAYRLGHRALLVEGGPTTLASFLEAGAVDRLDLFVAEGRFGEGRRLALTRGLEFARSRLLGPDAWATFVRPGAAWADAAWEDAVTDSGSTSESGGPP